MEVGNGGLPLRALGCSSCLFLTFFLSTELKEALSVMLEGAGSGKMCVLSGRGQKMQSCLKSVPPRGGSVIPPGEAD